MSRETFIFVRYLMKLRNLNRGIRMGLIKEFIKYCCEEQSTVPISTPAQTPNFDKFVLDDTITNVFNHASLTRYNNLPLADCKCETNSIFSFEITLHENIVNPDIYVERDVNTLNRHYVHLRNDCMNYGNKMYLEKSRENLCAQQEFAVCGFSTIDTDKNILEFNEFLRRNWFFLYPAIKFLTISRVGYDKFGKICVVKFKIGAPNELYPEPHYKKR